MTNRYNPSSSTPINPDSPFHVFIVVCFVAIFSYGAARLGGVLVLRPEMIWPLWPGCAFLVAVLLLSPRKIWPALLLAGLAGFALYDVQEHLPIRAIGLLLVADSVEILLAALGVTYVFGGLPRLNSVKSLAKYSLFAVILAPVSVASVATSALKGNSWWVGFFTEALALLTLTPAILSWGGITLTRGKKPKPHYLEAASMFVGLATLAYFTFVASGSGSRPTLLYSLVPFLLWAALRFGITGTSNSIVLVAFLAILGAVHGRGPFTGDTRVHNVLSLQLFLLVAASSFMVLAAVVEEHKVAEQALCESAETVRASEDRLRLAQQAAGIGTFEQNVRTGVVTWTPEMESLYGLPLGGFGQTQTAFENLVHPDDRARVMELADCALRTGQQTTAEWRVLWPDGSVHWIAGRWQVFMNESGEPSRMIGVNMDVTERKLADEAIAGMSRKLIEAQEQERTRIGRELHDDINQRLAMLALELEQLQESSEAPLRIQELRKEIAGISSDVQALSHDLHSSKLEYLGVVAGIKSWCKEFGERQKIEIDCKTERSRVVPLEVGLSLFRVLQEAVHNAIKHSGVRRIEVELWEDCSEIHLAISDLGRGFDLEAALAGKGLGLTSMRERVRLLNGTIVIESKPMGGTTIHVRVPFQAEHVSQREAV
jgi:PAS domain S-box-containing protein